MQLVVLGLGSNIGCSVLILRQAVNLISLQISKVIKFSPIYKSKALLPLNAPKGWDVDYYNLAVLLRTNKSPEILLFEIKQIEKKLGRDPDHSFWAPREIDIDILCYGNLQYNSQNLQIPHNQLLKRNFALKPLLHLYPDWNHPSFNQNLHLYAKNMSKLILSPFSILGSKIMAIVNLSKDSFTSNENSVIEIKNFKQHIISLINQGAEIIDLGAESTRPGAQKLTATTYWEILKPYLDIIEDLLKLHNFPVTPKVSIDTYHTEVVKKSLNYRCVTVINNIYDEESELIAKLLKNTSVKYIFMHQLGVAGEHYLQVDCNPVAEIIKFAKKRIDKLIQIGLSRNQLIFDIGIGFAKHPYQVQCLLDNITEIQKKIGIELLAGHSRKESAIGFFSKANNQLKDIASSMISRDLIKKHIDYLRVHNVQLTALAKLTV